MELARIVNTGIEHRPEPSGSPTPPGDRRMEVIHALMRGRYRWAILLGVVLAVPAGWGGYKLGKPTYRSDVPIRVELTERRVLYNDEEKAALPRYESFAETQMSLIRSQRVLDLAMQDPAWTALRNPNAPDATLKFLNNLTVERKDELITVSFDDTDPQAAMAGAGAAVRAYRQLYKEEVTASESSRLGILLQLDTALSNDLESKTQRMASLTVAKYGVHDIRPLTERKNQELHALEEELGTLELQAALITPTTQPSGPAAAPADLHAKTAEDFAATDQVLASLLFQQSQQNELLAKLKFDGQLENSPKVKDATFQLGYLQEAIKARLEKLQAAPGLAIPSNNRTADPAMTLDPKILNERLAVVRGLKEKADVEYKALDEITSQTDDLRSQIDEIKKRLQEARTRIDGLNIESSMNDRITFPTDANGERPLEPFKDTRRKFAVAGAAGAGLLGFGIILAFTLLDRSVRSADEVRVRLSLGKLLGVLPALPQDMSNPEQAAAAAHAVHQIRSMLQIRAASAKPCFAVTSPLSGSGKTSLSLALAFSFASTGSKTLLIDCDVVAGGLTRKLNATARTRIGRMLRRQGLFTSIQLRQALKSAKLQHKRIGKVLVERGMATPDDIIGCVNEQSKMSLGLIDALNGEPLVNCVAATSVPNCYVLPIGRATSHHAVSISPAGVKRLIAAAREQFDVIVVDSGPIPGSLEASAAAAAVDGVVMLVSRGEPRAVVEECLARLRAVGATLAGVVLNRVEKAEMSAYSGSVSRTSRDGLVSGAPGLRVQSVEMLADVGPIARAVVCSAPAGEDENQVEND